MLRIYLFPISQFPSTSMYSGSVQAGLICLSLIRFWKPAFNSAVHFLVWEGAILRKLEVVKDAGVRCIKMIAGRI